MPKGPIFRRGHDKASSASAEQPQAWKQPSLPVIPLPPAREVLVMVMRKHQRYFPVVDPQTNGLLPHFITVANGAVNVNLVRAGNEAVLRARFEDARFFYEADTKKSLEQHR